MSLRERAYLSLKFYNRPIAVGIPAFLFLYIYIYSFPFFFCCCWLPYVQTLTLTYAVLGFYLFFCFLFCLATKIQHTKCQFRDWIIHWDFVTFICSFNPWFVQQRNRERNLIYLFAESLDAPRGYRPWKEAFGPENSPCPWRTCRGLACESAAAPHLPARTLWWPSWASARRRSLTTIADLD